MKKNEQLDSLFDDWKQHYPDYKDNFIKDGIVDEDLYDRESPKLLFIAKEANTTIRISFQRALEIAC
jgi:hypothetical protein